eukprot:6362288-Amphidinium_carterae.1
MKVVANTTLRRTGSTLVRALRRLAKKRVGLRSTETAPRRMAMPASRMGEEPSVFRDGLSCF